MQIEICITPENRDVIMSGRMCPYCGGKTEYINSRLLYGNDLGMAYRCEPCSAWVGCHKGTSVSLGRLANGQLRALKREGHKWFDPLWKRLANNGYNKYEARRKTYLWLAGVMGIKENECHFGMFNEEQCKAAITICKRQFSQPIKKLGKVISK